MGKKSREKREKLVEKINTPSYAPLAPKKKGLSTGVKVLIGLAIIAVIVIAGSVALSPPQSGPQQTQEGYPLNVAPTFYSTPTLSTKESKLSLPLDYVNTNKLVFVDLKLETSTNILTYQDRDIPLRYYRNGEYLPLIIISTPSGNTVAGIRTCEPCGSFSFHIVKGANIKCDSCGAEWTIENFTPVSGGCALYPPPKVPSTIKGDIIEIDLSAVSIQLA